MALIKSYMDNGVYGTDVGGGVENLQASFNEILQSELIASFEVNNKLEGKYLYKKLNSGNYANFSTISNADVEFVKIGDRVTRKKTSHGMRKIGLDDQLMGVVTVFDADVAASGYDFASADIKQVGKKMAEGHAKRIIVNHLAAARGLDNINDTTLSAGNTTNAAVEITGYALLDTLEDKGIALANGLAQAKIKLDDAGVKEDGRFAVMASGEYTAIVNNMNAINSQFGAMGSISEGKVWSLFGFELINTNVFGSNEVDVNGNYFQNVSFGTAGVDKTLIVVSVDEAIGHVELMGVDIEDQRDALSKSTDKVVSKLVGYGILRNDCSVEIKEAV